MRKMKDQTFEIKVGDLLNQVAVDEMSFEHKSDFHESMMKMFW